MLRVQIHNFTVKLAAFNICGCAQAKCVLMHSYTAQIFVIARDVKAKTKTNTETKTNTKTKINTFLTCPDLRDGCKICLFSVYLPDCLLFVHIQAWNVILFV